MSVVNGNFAALGNSGTTFAMGNYAELIVGGTFVGTIQLQACIPGAGGAAIWVPVGSLTAPGAVTFVSGQCRNFRAECTAYTSGTAYYSVGASCNEAFIA